MKTEDIAQKTKEVDDRIQHKKLTADLTKEVFLQISIVKTFTDVIAGIDLLDFYAQEYWGYSSEHYNDHIKPMVKLAKEIIDEITDY